MRAKVIGIFVFLYSSTYPSLRRYSQKNVVFTSFYKDGAARENSQRRKLGFFIAIPKFKANPKIRLTQPFVGQIYLATRLLNM